MSKKGEAISPNDAEHVEPLLENSTDFVEEETDHEDDETLIDNEEAEIKQLKAEEENVQIDKGRTNNDTFASHSVEIAAAFVRDALDGRDYRHQTDVNALRILSLMHNFFYKLFMTTITILLFVLTVAEKPAIWNIPFGITQGIELFILLIFFIEVILQFRVTSSSIFVKRNLLNFVTLFIIFFTFIDVIVYIAMLNKGLRVTRLLRAYFGIIRVDRVKETFKHTFYVFKSVGIIIIAIICVLMLYSTIGRILFHNIEDENFKNYEDAFVTVFGALTTANLPDVMIPSYKANRWYALYFITFLIFGIYLVLSITLAFVYSAYRKAAQSQALRRVTTQRTALLAAFKAMDHEGRGFIDKDQFHKLYKLVRPLSKSGEHNVLFEMMDRGKDGTLDAEDFITLFDLIFMTIKKKTRKLPPNLKKIFNYLRSSRAPKLRKFLMTNTYRIISGALVFLSFVMVGYFIWEERAAETIPLGVTIGFHIFDCIIIVLFIIEVILNIVGYGFINYFKHSWRLLDFFLVALIILEKLIVELIVRLVVARSPMVYKVQQLLHMARVFKLFTTIHTLRVLMKTFFQMIAILFYFFIVVLLHYYFFAILGMEFFGRTTLDENTQALEGTSFLANEYYVIATFSNISDAYMALFHLMTVSCWHITAFAYMNVYGDISLLFFIIFYFSTVTIILNLVVAFVVEAFMMKFEKNKQKQKQAIEDEHKKLRRVEKGFISSSAEQKEQWETKQSLLMSASFISNEMLDAKSAPSVQELETNLEKGGITSKSFVSPQ